MSNKQHQQLLKKHPTTYPVVANNWQVVGCFGNFQQLKIRLKINMLAKLLDCWLLDVSATLQQLKISIKNQYVGQVVGLLDKPYLKIEGRG